MARRDALLRLHKSLLARRADLRKKLAEELKNLRDFRSPVSTGDSADVAFESGSDEMTSHLAEIDARELTQIDRALTRPAGALRASPFPPRVPRAMKRVATALFLGCCSFLGGTAAVSLGPRLLPAAWAQSGGPGGLFAPAPADGGRAELTRLGERFEYVARKVAPAVVSLDATKLNPRAGGKRSVEESGSGVLVRVAGQPGVFVLTNNHVIQQAPPQQITVSLADN